MRGENDDRLNFPIRGEITLRLVNQTSDRNHIQQTIEFNDKSIPEACERVKDCNDFARIGISMNQLVPLALLDYSAERGTQYLVNDTIYIQVMYANFVHRSYTFWTSGASYLVINN